MSYDHWKTKSDLDDWAALNHPDFPDNGEMQTMLIPKLTTEEALQHAIELLDRSGVLEHDLVANGVAKRFEQILAQRGCAHFDKATDRLVDLVDVIIDG